MKRHAFGPARIGAGPLLVAHPGWACASLDLGAGRPRSRVSAPVRSGRPSCAEATGNPRPFSSHSCWNDHPSGAFGEQPQPQVSRSELMPASVRLAAASAVAASLFATALPARSADLYGHRPATAPPTTTSAMAIATATSRRSRSATEPQEEYAPLYPPRRAFRDDDFDGDGRYEFPRYAAREDGCVPRRLAHERMRADGWSRFPGTSSRARQPRLHAGAAPIGAALRSDHRHVLGRGHRGASPVAALGRSFAGTPRRYWQPLLGKPAPCAAFPVAAGRS